MTCKWCGIKEVEGRQVYCSDKCKQAAYRNKRNEPAVTDVTVTPAVTPRAKNAKLLQLLGTGQGVPNYGQPDCQCKHCQSNRANNGRLIINHGPYKPAGQLDEHEVNRVCLPGDADYVEVGCVTLTGKYVIVKGMVNGRKAVKYPGIAEKWPEPLSPDDTPVLMNWPEYERPDGTGYLFNYCGVVRELDASVLQAKHAERIKGCDMDQGEDQTDTERKGHPVMQSEQSDDHDYGYSTASTQGI